MVVRVCVVLCVYMWSFVLCVHVVLCVCVSSYMSLSLFFFFSFLFHCTHRDEIRQTSVSTN